MRHHFVLVALLVAAPSARAVTYDVGPGQPLSTIGQVPWATLQPGDVVQIHWQPAPYREKWVIARQGTQALPIVVRGVPGPAGELPVISGEDAVTAPGLDFWNDERGVIKIGGSSVPADTLPAWIVIEGLDLRSAHAAYSFTDDRGTRRAYANNAAALYVEKVENLAVRGCDLHDSGNGLFIGSSPTVASRGILIEGCHLWDNGNGSSAFEHNNYTAAIDLTFEGNWFGPTKAGANGNNLKDRSAGLVVRYNWIEGGNRQLDLVDAEDSSLIATDPSYRETFVYGNVLVETEGAGNRQVVHYGGDSGTTAQYRKGMLHFFNNTVVSYRTDRTTLFRLSTNEERCDARNNVVYTAAAAGSTLALLDDTGVLDWSHDLVKPGWVVAFFGYTGTFNDDGTTITAASPGFVDEAAQDFHLAASSPCVDAGTALLPAALPAHEPVLQYAKHQSTEARPTSPPLDVGAYELDTCVPPLPPDVVTRLRVTRAALTWDAGADATSWDVATGDITTLRQSGLGASLLGCLESASPDAASTDPSPTPPGGAWYLVRGSNCAGNGTLDSGDPRQIITRDAALAAACP